MDKEAFLHQLESSAANKDNKLFAKTIYDLPADVIVGFTKEEFSRIIYISHHFSSQKMDRLFNFLENKGLFSLKNALKGIDELNNFLLSKFYYSSCISLYETNKEKVKRVLVNNAIVCDKLAEMGVDSRSNLEKAVGLYGDAQKIFPKASASYARALMNEGNARQTLAGMGVDSRPNLETAVGLYGDAQKIFPKASASYARALMNEGNARKTLAEMGVDSRSNLEKAVGLYGDAQKIFPKTSADYASALMNEGTARKTLAVMGVDSRSNLETAVGLYGDAQKIFPKASASYASALMNEGTARQTLAGMGVDSRPNLETAVGLYGDAQKIFPKASASYARALMNEGSARQTLAGMGVDSRSNLEKAVGLYGDAQKIFPKASASYARALMNEGSARQTLAGMGVDSRENLETAVSLYGDAKEIFTKTSADYARVLVNEGSTRKTLAEMDVDSQENYNRSKKLYLESISILEKLGDGWVYSIALLNLNSLLKNNFYKTGDKKNLEEWEGNLGDIEEKIKDRDIRYKERLIARIHEIRASLLEFDGKSGIQKASREYDTAYKLSKDPFYNFMDEFCQARIDTKSFCELVSDWKLEEKKGIFLDYYDYTVFECHLENALKSTINEEDELKLAVEKLTEIRDRTQIKIIKDRVSAYMYLLKALVDCFTTDSYKEAAANVKEGCKIFREYGDKQGQQMCEIFHNAVVKKRDPEAWQEIIRNREFSSNFYSLLCEYSDRKRADIECYRFDQVHEIMGAVSKDIEQVKEISIRTENKIDEIQSQIHSGFAEIKGQIEEGFDGTAAELRQIKGKINNIEQDLDNLVRISNDVGGKEGECIREFASQMLEIMKKGDSEALKRFSEKIVQNSSSITEIIEAAEIPEKEKTEAKSKLSDFKKIPGILKEKAKSFSVDVTKDVVVSLTAEEIITYLTPVLSTAAFGVPIPSQVVGILLKAIRNS
ncbi:Clp amino terminal domain protein [Methanosarcina lacustris Z-7289]|uniref:Clp amino terminal domain protein n=1 Tax=Methanosarcina lacustris Z-7289 TaxID=1434111 RepID=A0A0E3S1X7_9EURY|nr:hypothetical protein [Methanosarcina lacustris]AKB74101.1 Clp amino terminal domain protein [Methanosarcina lacustris Z-7289]